MTPPPKKKKQQQTRLTVKWKEINQQIFVKAGRLRKTGTGSSNWTFQNDGKKFYQQVNGENTRTNWIQRKLNSFGARYWNIKEYNRKPELIIDMIKSLKKVNIKLDSLRAILKKVPNWKTPSYNGICGF